jgi:hypothetical protein
MKTQKRIDRDNFDPWIVLQSLRNRTNLEPPEEWARLLAEACHVILAQRHAMDNAHYLAINLVKELATGK